MEILPELWRRYEERSGIEMSKLTEEIDEQISDAFQVAIANYWEEKSKYLTPPPVPSVPCRDCKKKEGEADVCFSYQPINPFQRDFLSKEDRILLDGIRNAILVCGQRGDDVEFLVHQTLKKMGRNDLLPPCYTEEKQNADAKEKEGKQ